VMILLMRSVGNAWLVKTQFLYTAEDISIEYLIDINDTLNIESLSYSIVRTRAEWLLGLENLGIDPSNPQK